MPKLLSLSHDFEAAAMVPLAAERRLQSEPASESATMGLRNGVTDTAPDLLAADIWTPESGKGLRLAVDQPIEERYLAAERIAIEFPAFNDGRGLSLAVLLRSRHGYTGDVMATGDVHEDMLHYLRRCGFTSFLIPDERNLDSALSTFAPYSDYYQASVVQPEPAFRRIERGG